MTRPQPDMFEYDVLGNLVPTGLDDAVSVLWEYDVDGNIVPRETPNKAVTPLGFALADVGTGGALTASITNGASYTLGEIINVYDTDGVTFYGAIDGATGTGDICGLTDDQEYIMKCVAANDSSEDSDFSATATGTPTGDLVNPDAALMVITDNQDGTGATATLSNCTAGITYYIYTTRHQTKDWVLSGSRVGNGEVDLALAKGEYIATAIGGVVQRTLGQAAFFWVTAGSLFRTRTVERNAQSLLRTISGGGTSRAKGSQVTIEIPGVDDDLIVWAMEIETEQITSLVPGISTDTQEKRFLIPRQTGFPPAAFKVGMKLTDEDDNTFGITSVKGDINLSPAFTFDCMKHVADGSDGDY